jgi:hypothetical protein
MPIEIGQNPAKVADLASTLFQIPINGLAGFGSPADIIAKATIVEAAGDIEQGWTDIVVRQSINLAAFGGEVADDQLFNHENRGVSHTPC